MIFACIARLFLFFSVFGFALSLSRWILMIHVEISRYIVIQAFDFLLTLWLKAFIEWYTFDFFEWPLRTISSPHFAPASYRNYVQIYFVFFFLNSGFPFVTLHHCGMLNFCLTPPPTSENPYWIIGSSASVRLNNRDVCIIEMLLCSLNEAVP